MGNVLILCHNRDYYADKPADEGKRKQKEEAGKRHNAYDFCFGGLCRGNRGSN